ncbi:MAG: SdpI family protein [Cyclobacteriaceae bacterium]|nr:SdpI family protein [Cyclobacteriaceae bacterium]
MIYYFILGGLITIVGLLFYTFPPKKINLIYGYRTRRSMRNQETWEAANRYSSLLMILAGILGLLSGSICLLLGASVIIPQIVVVILLVLLMVMTERFLKKTFPD